MNLTVPQVKQLLGSIARRDALEDIRLNDSMNASIGPVVNQKNKSLSAEWFKEKDAILDA